MERAYSASDDVLQLSLMELLSHRSFNRYPPPLIGTSMNHQHALVFARMIQVLFWISYSVDSPSIFFCHIVPSTVSNDDAVLSANPVIIPDGSHRYSSSLYFLFRMFSQLVSASDEKHKTLQYRSEISPVWRR